jgi:hypothetical protein
VAAEGDGRQAEVRDQLVNGPAVGALPVVLPRGSLAPVLCHLGGSRTKEDEAL